MAAADKARTITAEERMLIYEKDKRYDRCFGAGFRIQGRRSRHSSIREWRHTRNVQESGNQYRFLGSNDDDGRSWRISAHLRGLYRPRVITIRRRAPANVDAKPESVILGASSFSSWKRLGRRRHSNTIQLRRHRNTLMDGMDNSPQIFVLRKVCKTKGRLRRMLSLSNCTSRDQVSKLRSTNRVWVKLGA